MIRKSLASDKLCYSESLKHYWERKERNKDLILKKAFIGTIDKLHFSIYPLSSPHWSE